MKPARAVLAVVLLSLSLCRVSALAAASDADVARSRFPRLTRGINVGWLNNRSFTLNRERAEKEAALIQAAGCRHVRMYLNVDGLRDPSAREKPDVQKLPALDAAIDIALKHDLAALVDTFHYGTGGLLKFPGPDDPEAEVMVKFWGALAKHLAKHDPDRVFLEVANEPGLENPLDWYAVEIRVLKAMRAAAPHHTLIAGYNMRAGKNDWDGIKALTMFPVVPDRNVVYNFHYYSPMAMTHQGASWAGAAASKLRGVPYPSDPEIIKPVAERTTDPAARRLVERYGADRWNREKIRAQLAVAAEWANKHGVLVTCNEFGVYRPVAPPAARAAWTRDVRESLEQLGIGWTIWNSAFGFLPGRGGKAGVDEDIIRALGLKMP
jgi:hypothetical protein